MHLVSMYNNSLFMFQSWSKSWGKISSWILCRRNAGSRSPLQHFTRILSCMLFCSTHNASVMLCYSKSKSQVISWKRTLRMYFGVPIKQRNAVEKIHFRNFIVWLLWIVCLLSVRFSSMSFKTTVSNVTYAYWCWSYLIYMPMPPSS